MVMSADIATILTNGAHVAKLIVQEDVLRGLFIRDIGGAGAIMAP